MPTLARYRADSTSDLKAPDLASVAIMTSFAFAKSPGTAPKIASFSPPPSQISTLTTNRHYRRRKFPFYVEKAVYRARARRFRSVHEQAMFFQAGLRLSRSSWTTHSVLIVGQLSHPRAPPSCRLDLQRLYSFIRQQEQNGGKSGSSALKLFHQVLLDLLVVAQRVEAVLAHWSMQMAEGPQIQQTHCRPRAPERSRAALHTSSCVFTGPFTPRSDFRGKCGEKPLLRNIMTCSKTGLPS